MPETPIIYEDVELVEVDGLGFTVRMGNDRVFVGKYVPLSGTTVRQVGDRGRLCLPRWFVEEQRLPLDRHLTDADVEKWLVETTNQAATAEQQAKAHPEDPHAQDAVDRATGELAAAMVLRARRRPGVKSG